MSNKRINLTESELRKQIIKHEGEYSYPTSDVDMGDVETILHCINGIGLIAELKRCYEELDFLKANVLNDDELWWIATCKPDGEGQCTMEIEGYEELMRLVKEGKVEIPEYSHGFDELLLQEGCECGVTHDEWLEGKN